MHHPTQRPNPEKVLVSLAPDSATRHKIAQLIARSILKAHKASPSCWSLTLTKHRLRLNVGKIEVLAVFKHCVHLVVYRKGGPTTYASVSGSKSIELRGNAIHGGILHHARKHRALVARAAKTSRTSSWAAHHSTAACEYVAKLAGLHLPSPGDPKSPSAVYPHAAKVGIIPLVWLDPISKNYVDLLPMSIFDKSDSQKGVLHDVHGPKGGVYEAKCDVTVSGCVAELDYAAYREENEDDGMLPGVARITFSDNDRTRIVRTEWKPDGSPSFKKVPFTVGKYVLPSVPPYHPATSSSKKVKCFMRERPGQRVFRKRLKLAYAHRCCITRCTVSEALEGAHIDPYLNTASDNPRNGLLLRRDIHALFDALLLGVNPETHRVQLAAVVRNSPEYRRLDGRKIEAPTNSTYAPDQEALQRHWKRFSQTSHCDHSSQHA